MASITGATAVELTNRLRMMWDASAPTYLKLIIENNQTTPGSQPTLQEVQAILAGRKSDPRVLDLASASGEPALTIAQAFPAGHVICSDFSQAMVDAAAQRVRNAKVNNVTCQQVDAQDLSAFEDASFDVVTCQFGLMLVPDYTKALQEMLRVLKPGGAVVMAVHAHQLDTVDFANRVGANLLGSQQPGAAPAAPPPIDGITRFANVDILLDAMRAAGLSVVASAPFTWGIRWSLDAARAFVIDIGPRSAAVRKLREGPRPNIDEEAMEAVLATATAMGKLQGNEVVLENNVGYIVTGRRAAA